MDVQMCNVVLVLYQHPVDMLGRERALMNAHGIRKRAGKQIVIANRHLRDHVRERPRFFWAEVRQRGYVPLVWQH